jgi:hypothetical protein
MPSTLMENFGAIGTREDLLCRHWGDTLGSSATNLWCWTLGLKSWTGRFKGSTSYGCEVLDLPPLHALVAPFTDSRECAPWKGTDLDAYRSTNVCAKHCFSHSYA